MDHGQELSLKPARNARFWSEILRRCHCSGRNDLAIAVADLRYAGEPWGTGPGSGVKIPTVAGAGSEGGGVQAIGEPGVVGHDASATANNEVEEAAVEEAALVAGRAPMGS